MYLVCERGVQQVSRLCVDDAFRFPRTARCVEKKQQIFTVQRLRRTDGRLRGHHLGDTTRYCSTTTTTTDTTDNTTATTITTATSGTTTTATATN